MWWQIRKTHCAAFVNSGWEHHCRHHVNLLCADVAKCQVVIQIFAGLAMMWTWWRGNGFRDILSFVKLWWIVIYQPSDLFVRQEFEVACCHLCLRSWWWIFLGCCTENVGYPNAHTASRFGLETERRAQDIATWEECTWKSQRYDGEHAKRICESLN